MTVDLRLLRYFVAVADELHFGRAAAGLYVSQPALSQQIRKLENDLGTELFVRDRRTVELTASGRRLLGPARSALAAADDFAAAARGANRAERRLLTVGFMIPWPDGFLPRVLRAFRERCPDVDVDVRQFDFRDTTVGLRTGESDVSLLHLPLTWTGALTSELDRVPRVVMLPEDSPLAQRSSVTVAELVATGLPWATPPAEADEAWRRFWSAADERAALGVAGTPLVSLTPEAYLSQVATGAALGLTEAPVEDVYRPPGIRFVPVAGLAPSVRAVGRRRDDARADVRTMVETIRDVAGAPPAAAGA